MSHFPQRDFEDEPATAVMPDEVVAELTARSRDAAAAEPLSGEPTKVAKISVAEIFAAAGVELVVAPAASAPARGLRPTWRRAAVFALAAALVATLAILLGHSFGTR